MDEDRTQADWSMNKEVLQRVAALTNDSYKSLLAMRFDASKTITFLDCQRGIWRECKPIISLGKNYATFKVDIDDVEKKFNELYPKATKECNRASKQYAETLQPRGASAAFLLEANQLFDEIMKVAQRMGLGMSIKRYTDYDTKTSINRAIG